MLGELPGEAEAGQPRPEDNDVKEVTVVCSLRHPPVRGHSSLLLRRRLALSYAAEIWIKLEL